MKVVRGPNLLVNEILYIWNFIWFYTSILQLEIIVKTIAYQSASVRVKVVRILPM